jgi:AsmA protein
VVLLLAFLLPMLVDVDRFVPQIETQLGQALGRQVTVGRVQMSLFHGGLVADNFAISDDPAYSTQPFLQAKQLVVGVELMPLLLDRELHVKKFEVVSPSLAMIENAAGKWNFSTLGTGAATQAKASTGSSSTSTLTVDSLEIQDATLTVQRPGMASHVYDKVDATAEKFSFTGAFPFTLTAALPGDGTVKMNGTLGPISNTNSSSDSADNTLTPLNADVTVTHLEPVGSGLVSANSGLDGVLDGTAHIASDGKTAQANGNVTGNKMRFSTKGKPASTTVTVNFATAYDLASQTGTVTKGAVSAGGVNANIGGTYLMKATGAELHLSLNAPGISVDAAQSLLPAFGVVLPNGAALKGGTLSAAMKIDGPVENLVIAGPVDLENTRLEGFSLAQKLGPLPLPLNLGSLTSPGKAAGAADSGTAIQQLKADVVVTSAQVQTSNVLAVVTSLGQATGSGVVLPDGAINFKMQVSLTALNSLGSLTRGLSSLLGGGASGVNVSIPLLIGGTTANPTFKLDASALGFGKASGGGSSAPANVNSTVNALKGLFGK